ncbi:MAG: tRNA 5-methoxyuridine(34)/uridine 5-oxyacetic acid(34) synthase CmoB [Proteobacteria bacterium]|nr:tRNA 5-methoxyuridine(34)/uridine 5-oxyacetic acid(34) synthase CmoB [Pseudomonadota bacterium]
MSPYIFQHSPHYQDYLDDPNFSSLVDVAAIRQHRANHSTSSSRHLLSHEKTFIHGLSLLEPWIVEQPPMSVEEFISRDGLVGPDKSFIHQLGESSETVIQEVIQAFVPWKKGPFRLFNVTIDSEWRCQDRWYRMSEKSGCVTEDSSPLRVADVGCNSGYFMFRMVQYPVSCVIGFEPTPKHFFCFHVFQNFLKHPKLHYEPFGYQQLFLYPNFFDLILCLGVLYHHTDPIKILRECRKALAPKGKLIIDCQGIDGEESIALFPKKRYAGCSGFWWLPTLSCLENWVRRAGFSRWVVFHNDFLSTQEQRTTEFAPIKSLADHLDPQDPRSTIEGYPAPKRFYLTVYR